jgi:hypothetical protein
MCVLVTKKPEMSVLYYNATSFSGVPGFMLAVQAAVLLDCKAQLQSPTLLSQISRYSFLPVAVPRYLGQQSGRLKMRLALGLHSRLQCFCEGLHPFLLGSGTCGVCRHL